MQNFIEKVKIGHFTNENVKKLQIASIFTVKMFRIVVFP